MKKEDVIKQIDGAFYYHSDYADFLYKQLEIKDLILKALHKYFNEHEQYEDNEFLKQQEKYKNMLKRKNKEIERLNNIIKEVREYIEERYNGEVLTHTFDKDNVGELLEILDRERV